MKMFIVALSFLGLSIAGTANAATIVAGDKINFQKESAFVSAVFSKTLCLNGDVYEATITKCAKWQNDGQGERSCLETVKVQARQPMKSTTQRCAAYEGEAGEKTCVAWITVPFVQNPVRNVSFYNQDQELIKTATVTIPACH